MIKDNSDLVSMASEVSANRFRYLVEVTLTGLCAKGSVPEKRWGRAVGELEYLVKKRDRSSLPGQDAGQGWGSDYSCSQDRIWSRWGMDPACTSLPSTATAGVDIT